MSYWLKWLIPKTIKTYFRNYLSGLIQREIDHSNDLGLRVNNLQLHSENLTKLLIQTIENLDAVGHSLKEIHHDQVSQINELSGSILKSSHLLNQQQISILLLQRQLPTIITMDQHELQLIESFKIEFNVPFDFDIHISKEDVMFLYSLDQYKQFDTAIHNYLTIGYSGFHIVRTLVEYLSIQSNEKPTILDFASGYGRVTRFLAGYFGAEQISTSDIKKDAVDFQQKYFGVDGIYSDYNPQLFQPKQAFHFTFAGSLFSHLNKELFEAWLFRLLACTIKNGYLIFSVHDMSLHPEQNNKDHIFVEKNEDEKFPFLSNAIQSTKLYGISFVTETFVKGLLNKHFENLNYVRYPKAFGGLQDVYIVSSNPKMPLPELDFNMSLHHS